MGAQGEVGTSSPFRLAIDTVATTALLGICASLMWLAFVGQPSRAVTPPPKNTGRPRPPAKVPADPVPIGGAATRGSRSARAVLLQYSDFSCAACASFARDVFPVIDREYISSGRVLFVFRHLPMQAI